MSFYSDTKTQVVPRGVQLQRSLPVVTDATVNRTIQSANTSSSFDSGSELDITVNTATPGVVTNTTQSTLDLVLMITNSNPFIDYVNFGRVGAQIVIDTFRVKQESAVLEENTHYSETINFLMMQACENDEPYHLFRRNQWRANAGTKNIHINFIKPSMVDSAGNPMYGHVPYLDQNPVVSESLQYMLMPTHAGNTPIAGMMRGTSTSVNPYLDGAGGVGGNSYLNVNGAITTALEEAGEYYGRYMSTNCAYVNWKAMEDIQEDAVKSKASAFYGPSNFTPALWPDYQPYTLSGNPLDTEVDLRLGGKKVVEYMRYLSNVKSFPVGLRGSTTIPTHGATFYKPTGQLQPTSKITEHRCSMPLYSSLLGVLAKKYFFNMLIGANSMTISIKLASNAKVLQVTMDPCRRVPGTVRDFVPYTGSSHNNPRKLALNSYDGVEANKKSVLLPDHYVIIKDEDTPDDGGFFNGSQCFTTEACCGEGYLKHATKNARHHLAIPQYVPVASPWTVKDPTITNLYIPESQSCYGTYLPCSEPQTRRCLTQTRLEAPAPYSPGGGEPGIFYSVRDVKLITESIQLNDEIAKDIVKAAVDSSIDVYAPGIYILLVKYLYYLIFFRL